MTDWRSRSQDPTAFPASSNDSTLQAGIERFVDPVAGGHEISGQEKDVSFYQYRKLSNPEACWYYFCGKISMPYNYPCQHPSSYPSCTLCQREDSDNTIKRVWPPAGTDEPETVKALFFLSALTEWRNYMACWRPSLSYGGVFVHKKPYCTFNAFGTPPVDATGKRGAHRCELGDLLVIFSDVPARRRVAALFQAKMIGGTWPPISAEGSQWALYSEWPTFCYTLRGKTGVGIKKVCTLPFSGGHDPAAQYLQLDDAGLRVDCTEVLAGPSWISWAQIVNRMLNGGAGRDFSWDQASAVNEWDKLIWDLITVTATCPMSGGVGAGVPTGGAKAGISDRGVLQWLDTLDKSSVSPDGHLPNKPAFMSGDDDEVHGISLMHFTRRGENQRT